MKIKYKKYPQTYEKVFTSEGCLKTFGFEKMDTDYPGSKTDYVDAFRNFFSGFDRILFDLMIKYYWLQRRFIYDGFRKERHGKTFFRTDSAYSTFVKHHLGFNYNAFTSWKILGVTVSYFADFFGHKIDGDPFKNPELYAFPYKNIGLAHMFLVYQMDERMDLLKEAEENKMSYYEFIDFVINYTYSVNEEKGKEIFTFYSGFKNNPPYIIYRFRSKKRFNNKKYEVKTSNVCKYKI